MKFFTLCRKIRIFADALFHSIETKLHGTLNALSFSNTTTTATTTVEIKCIVTKATQNLQELAVHASSLNNNNNIIINIVITIIKFV